MKTALALLAIYAFLLGLREVGRQAARLTRWVITVVRHDGP